MIIMTRMKLSPLQNSKANRIQFYISILLIGIGEILFFIQISFEQEYSNKYLELGGWKLEQKLINPEFNIGFGLWTIPLVFGIILLCSVFIHMNLSNKNIKYQIIKYYKYKKREAKKQLLSFHYYHKNDK